MRLKAALTILLLSAGHAAATELKLDGIWGNEAGCRFAKDGNRDNDALIVLRPDGVEAYASACEWIQVLAAKDGTQVATGLCSYEGQEERGVETFVIRRALGNPDVLRMDASGGEPWAELRKCK